MESLDAIKNVQLDNGNMSQMFVMTETPFDSFAHPGAELEFPSGRCHLTGREAELPLAESLWDHVEAHAGPSSPLRSAQVEILHAGRRLSLVMQGTS